MPPFDVTVELPRRPLTVADYGALPETEAYWSELAEGQYVVRPNGGFAHGLAVSELGSELSRAAGPDRVIVHRIDLDLQLASPDAPGTVRCVDFVVMTRQAYRRALRDGLRFLRAADIFLVIEITTAESRRTDTVVKLGEYADAGIPNYWIVDLDDGPSLVANRLVDGRYEAAEPVRGQWRAEAPFPVLIDLSALS